MQKCSLEQMEKKNLKINKLKKNYCYLHTYVYKPVIGKVQLKTSKSHVTEF